MDPATYFGILEEAQRCPLRAKREHSYRLAFARRNTTSVRSRVKRTALVHCVCLLLTQSTRGRVPCTYPLATKCPPMTQCGQWSCCVDGRRVPIAGPHGAHAIGKGTNMSAKNEVRPSLPPERRASTRRQAPSPRAKSNRSGPSRC
jgi:hypothetical protein